MEITLSSFLPYPSIAIVTPHLTLLTSYRLVAIFPAKYQFYLPPASEFSQSKNLCGHDDQEYKCAIKLLLPINLFKDALFH